MKRCEHARAHVLIDAAPDLPLFRYFQDASPPSELWTFLRTERMGTIGAIRQRVLSGAGVAVLPRYLVDGDLRTRRLQVILPGRTLAQDHFRLVWRDGHPLETALTQLAAELAAIPLRVVAQRLCPPNCSANMSAPPGSRTGG